MSTPERFTNATGAPLADNSHIPDSRRGPALLQDMWLIEKLTLNREVIVSPGCEQLGAHGTLTRLTTSRSTQRRRPADPSFPFNRCHQEESKCTERSLRRKALDKLKPTTDIAAETAREISGAFNALLADVFALYLKIKNFLWHMNGPHFRDYHLLLDEQGDQLFGMIDDIAERVRKIGRTTLRSIGHIARASSALRIADADYVTPKDMLSELREDNKACSA